MANVGPLVGTLSRIASIQGTTADPNEHHDGPDYTGEVVVTPKAYEDQTLNTAGKYLTDDITIKKVPFVETHNDHGTTIYIAKEE